MVWALIFFEEYSPLHTSIIPIARASISMCHGHSPASPTFPHPVHNRRSTVIIVCINQLLCPCPPDMSKTLITLCPIGQSHDLMHTSNRAARPDTLVHSADGARSTIQLPCWGFASAHGIWMTRATTAKQHTSYIPWPKTQAHHAAT
jgi:hypothetical protein